MIEWKDTFDAQLGQMSDDELVRAYLATSQEPGDPVADAYCAEMKRRELSFETGPRGAPHRVA